VIVRSLQLRNFRNYATLDLSLGGGVVGVVGDNAQGKTNLVEALVVLSTLKSFRGVANDAVVRDGAEAAVLRADLVHDDGREFLIEIELKREGRSTVQINRKRAARTRDLLTALRTSVFMPEDLYLIRGAAAERRTVLDDAVVALDPTRHDLVGEVERVVRQRNSLLKDLGPRPTANALASLDAWDDKLAAIGDELGRARAAVVDDIAGRVQAAYAALAGDGVQVTLNYAAPWRETGLTVALREARDADLRRGTSTVGPHRDDLLVSIDALAARTQGSHGEQHSLGLALRMGIHHAVSDRWGSPPVLVLDDVLAGLDPRRKAAVFEQMLVHLPTRQVLVTSPEALPDSPRITRVLRVIAGTITDVTPEG